MRRLLLRAFALLTVVTIVVFFARDEIIEWLVPKIVSSNLGLELSVESIETSIQGKVVIRGVRSQSPESWAIVRDLDVDRVEAQLSPGRFFRGGLPLISLRADGLSIEIDTTRPGPPGDPPSETKEDDGEPFRWPESWPEVEATDARVVLRTGALDATFADVAVTLDRSETGNELEARGAVSWSLDESSGSFPFGLSAGYRKGIVSGASLDLSGAETLRDGRIDLATLDLQATLVTGTGEAAVAIEGLRGDETKLRAHAKSFELAELLPRLGLETQPFRGSVSLDAEAALDHDDWLDSTLLVAGRLRDAAWQGRPIPDASFDVEYADRIATASPLEVEDEFTTIVARSLRFRLGPQEIEPLDGVLRIVSQDLAASLAAFIPEIPAIEELGRPTLQASLAVEGKSIVIESIELDTALAKVEASEGRIRDIDLRAPEGVPFAATGRVRASVQSLALWRELLAERGIELDPAGSLDVQADVSVRPDSFAIEGVVEGSALAIGDLSIGDVEARASFENDRLDVRSFRLQGTDPAPLFVELSGSLSESGRADGSPHVELDLALRGEGLKRRLARFVAQLEDEIPDGAYAGRVQLSGDPRWPDVEVGIDVFPAETPADRPARPLGVRLAKSGDAFEVELRNVAAAGVRVSTIVNADVAPDLSRVAGTIESLLVIYEGEPWSSVQRSEFRFDQTERAMSLDPPLELFGPRREELGIGLREHPDLPGGRELEFFARAPNRVPIPAPEGLLRAFGLDAYARLVYDRSPWLEPTSWVPVEANARIGLRYTRVKQNDLVLDVRRATLLADWDESSPDSLLSLDIDEIDVGRLGEEAEGAGGRVLGGTIRDWIVSNAVLESRIRIGGPELSLDRFTLVGTGIQATATGRVTMENDVVRDLIASGLSAPGTIDLAANGRVDSLEILQPLVSGVRRIGGRWWSLATVRGSLSEPSIYARFALEEGRMRPEGAPGLDNLIMAGAYRDGTLTIGSLQTEIGGAPLHADGRVKWQVEGSPQADFRARGRNVLFVRNDNARIRGDVDLAVTGAIDHLDVTGTIDLTEGRVLGEVPLLDVLRTTARRLRGAASRAFEQRRDQAAQHAASLKLFSFGEAPLSEMRFNVDVNTRKRLELRGNLVRGYLRPEVRLLGTGRVPQLAGVIYLEEFTIELPATRLRVESGLIRFDERQALRPELELKAETRMLGYDVDVSVTGPVDDMTITLSSSPPLPSDDLFVLLVTGQLPETAGAEARQAALFTVAKYIGLDLIRQIFGGESLEDEESIIDRFEIEMGRDVSSTGRETLEVRFRLVEDVLFDEDTLYLVGERDKYDDYNAGLRIVIRGE